jgi:class 3 adenylate cyclase
VVDDVERNRMWLADLLGLRGYRVEQAASGREAIEAARRLRPDLILLDVVMPDLDGFEVCRTLRADEALAAVPIVMITALFDENDRQTAREQRLRGLEAGADDFLGKLPLEAELFARVRSLLRVKRLHDRLARLEQEQRESAAVLAARIEQQVRAGDALRRLRRFFAPGLAQRLLDEGERADEMLASHRREITVLFADLRGFTAFAEAVDPSTLMAVLGEFHAAMGEAIHAHEGTLERFTGDGLMVFFNDPQSQPDHTQRAVRLAQEMLRCGELLSQAWAARGLRLGLGLGASRGVATIGAVGFESRQDYAAIGPVTNRAARLCAEAGDGELLVCAEVWKQLPAEQRVAEVVPEWLAIEGLAAPMPVYRLKAAEAVAATSRAAAL